MGKYLRLLAALIFVASAITVRPAQGVANPYWLVTCYSGLTEVYAPDPSWTFSHQCNIGTTIWNVYIDFRGRWYLVSTTTPP